MLSAFFTLTSADLYFYILSNGTEIDIFYSLVVYLQAAGMLWFYEQKKIGALFVFSWVLCSIGFLTKGYPSLIFQFLTLLALCSYARNWRLIFHWKQLPGLTLFLAITCSYYYLYSIYYHPSVPLVNLLNESLMKSAVGEESTGRLYRVFTYPLLLLRVMSPWCFFFFLLFKKPALFLWGNPLVRFSALFILFNIMVYWVTGAQKTRYIVMFIPFVMTMAAYIYWQWEKLNPAFVRRCLKIAGSFFCLVIIALLAMPFISAVDLWKVLLPAGVMILFLTIYFRAQHHMIWLFLLGFILTRLIYAAVGIPEKAGGQYSYRDLAHRLVMENNNQPVYFWGHPETLNLDIVLGDTIYKWNGDTVKVVPYFIRYQLPFYFYKTTGVIPAFDTTIFDDRTYITLRPLLASLQVERLDSIYNDQFKEYFVVFRKRKLTPQATTQKINIQQ